MATIEKPKDDEAAVGGIVHPYYRANGPRGGAWKVAALAEADAQEVATETPARSRKDQ